ncbi:MAG: hypothetical protein M3Y03_01600 [Verrucomicrobiota bacterium]|nr:hypothetical protein [Verrucomicrobiota bacterium]
MILAFHVLRSIGAVFAGLLAIVLLSVGTDILLRASGVFPPAGSMMSNALFVLAVSYRCLYSIAGGYLAAHLARTRPMSHALWLGAIGLFLGLAGLIVSWNAGPEFGPKWYPLTLVLSAIPCAWLGGWLENRQTVRPNPA